MLYLCVEDFSTKSKTYRKDEVLRADPEKARGLIQDNMIKPLGSVEGLGYLISKWGKYPLEWLEEGLYYAFEAKPSPEAGSHLKDLLNYLKADLKAGIENGFYEWAKEKLELVHYLFWGPKEKKIDLGALGPGDLTGGEGELYKVVRAFAHCSVGDMILPIKRVAFPLLAEGYIRPALPGEALRYLVSHTNYPEHYLLCGAFYAFLYPNYPDLSPRAEEKVKQLFKDFEEAYEKGAFNRCREILSKARYLVWYDLEDLQQDIKRGRI